MSKIAGFWKSLKIQIARFWKSFQFSLEHNSKNIIQKNSIFCENNQPRRYYKMHIILFLKINLKRKKFIETGFFLKIKKMNIAGFLKVLIYLMYFICFW